MNLNGIGVKRVNGTIFIPLPHELWKESGGGCVCGKCDGSGMWDTLAVAGHDEKRGSHDWTWTVHYPELHREEYGRRRFCAEKTARVAERRRQGRLTSEANPAILR